MDQKISPVLRKFVTEQHRAYQSAQTQFYQLFLKHNSSENRSYHSFPDTANKQAQYNCFNAKKFRQLDYRRTIERELRVYHD